MIVNFNKREASALRQIKDWNGKFSIYWMPKSRERLVTLGFAEVVGDRVRITAAGEEALKGMK